VNEQAGYSIDKDVPLSELCNKRFDTSFSEEDVFAVLEASVYEGYSEIEFDFSKAISLAEVKQKLEAFKNEQSEAMVVDSLVESVSEKDNQQLIERVQNELL